MIAQVIRPRPTPAPSTEVTRKSDSLCVDVGGRPGTEDPASSYLLAGKVAGSWWWASTSRAALLEVLGDGVEVRPLHTVVAVDVLDEALQHEQHLRPAGDVRVHGDGERGVVHLPVDPVELVLPHLPDVPGI